MIPAERPLLLVMKSMQRSSTDSNITGPLNDLWKFDGNYWTWMSGSHLRGQVGNYGEIGIPNESNVPPSQRSTFGWTDLHGNLWLFGGDKSDLWIFDGLIWTWMSGSSSTFQYASYGDIGVSSPSNIPGGRTSAVSWTGNDGTLWMFGGYGNTDTSAG
jgi:hypothetical protein